MNIVRVAAVAGAFYPQNSTELGSVIDNLIDNVTFSGKTAPKAIIAPHAGYIYSGAVAASAYARVRSHAKIIKRVILLGPCHRVPVKGLALSSADFSIISLKHFQFFEIKIPGQDKIRPTKIPRNRKNKNLIFKNFNLIK